MGVEDSERKMVDCPYCGKAFNVPTLERQLAASQAKLDRLVEAAEAVVRDADGDDPDYRTVRPELVVELTAALAAIELPKSEDSNG